MNTSQVLFFFFKKKENTGVHNDTDESQKHAEQNNLTPKGIQAYYTFCYWSKKGAIKLLLTW